ncbi:MAG: biopolymer transporter Tol [Bryobacteraceae bacterium]|jgi:hypothetical protein
MKFVNDFLLLWRPSALTLALCMATALLLAQAPAQAPATNPAIPAWAYPGSKTYKQVPPPADFRRPSKTTNTPIGMFDGQTDVGSAIIPGSASYNDGTKQYTINSAGYNVWYHRDEFQYLWKKMSGDVSLAGTVSFPEVNGFGDRKVVFIIRKDLDDDSIEVMTARHGAGLIHLAQRTTKGGQIGATFSIRAPRRPADAPADTPVPVAPWRVGIEKKGDVFSMFISENGAPMHQVGQTLTFHMDDPFYVGIGFASHTPDKSDTAVVSDVVLENAAGKVQ